jgi:hypothetical protein
MDDKTTTASPADQLRQAAALMRERAQAATPGPWSAAADGLVWPEGPGDPVSGSTQIEDAEHIAGADPTTMLAVADLLNFSAATSNILDALGEDPDNRPAHHYALAVACAYLGTTRR